ncbi:sugar phosphate isomerase/epimerase family protein [Paenibacillus radicis (ex Xue et al. 2023)]|uniref:Sugar phosphate isomerase/epimerase n=1 Tax=Paenibacillus radicis (ex Xue et al. 2023) TaxID=2972489 RepID=A0ABT1YMF0_9BACL|nr:sugar phosphate isomerase/epimerase family protein [Paenibacillus radicis (ex Xue et al. 2023)]MCR8634354.1 sugar phosphate isomerase/epimerase [Paenibacillus radicis (ex Xue et al. 2023)]
MKTSLSVWSCHKYFYDQTWKNIDFIRFTGQETCAEGIELLHRFWYPDTESQAMIERALQQEGLEVACVGASNNFALPDAANRTEQLRQITESVDIAAGFGAKVVRVFSGNRQEGVDFGEARSWIVEGLKTAAEYAGARNVVLCLENHGLFAGKAEQVMDIIRDVDSEALRSTFDMGNFLLVDEQPGSALDVLQTMVGHVHAKDFTRVAGSYSGESYEALSGDRYAGKVLGEGSVDVRGLLSRLQTGGYNSWVTVEFEGDDEQRLGSIRSVEYVKQVLESLNS